MATRQGPRTELLSGRGQRSYGQPYLYVRHPDSRHPSWLPGVHGTTATISVAPRADAAPRPSRPCARAARRAALHAPTCRR